MTFKQLGYLRVFYFICFALHFVTSEDTPLIEDSTQTFNDDANISENATTIVYDIDSSEGKTDPPEDDTDNTEDTIEKTIIGTITCKERTSGSCIQSTSFVETEHKIIQFLGTPDADGFISIQPLINVDVEGENCLSQISIQIIFTAGITGALGHETQTSTYLTEEEIKESHQSLLKVRVNNLFTTCTNFATKIKILKPSKCGGARRIGKYYPIPKTYIAYVNPVEDFLHKKKKSLDYPILSLTKNSLHIDWGDLSRFGCYNLVNDSATGSLSFTMKRPGEDPIINQSISELNLNKFKSTSFKFDDKHVTNPDDIYCNQLLVTITLTNLKFGSKDDQIREQIVFKDREIRPKEFTATINSHIEDTPLSLEWNEEDTDKKDIDRHLHLSLEATSDSEFMCLQENAMIKEVTNGSEWKKDIILSKEKGKKEVDVSAYREKQCHTRQIQVVLKSSINNATVLNKTYQIPDSKIEGIFKTEIMKNFSPTHMKKDEKSYLKLESDSKDNIFKCLQNFVTIKYGDNKTDTRDLIGKYIDIHQFASEKCAKSKKVIEVTLKALNNSVVFQKNITFDNSTRGKISAAINVNTNQIELKGKMECIKEEIEINAGNSEPVMVKHLGKTVEFSLVEDYRKKKCEKRPLSIHIKVEFKNGDLADDEYLYFPETQITDTIGFDRMGDTLCLLPNTTKYPFRFEECLKKEAKVSLITDGLAVKSGMVPIMEANGESGSGCADKYQVDVSQYRGDGCRPEVLQVDIFDKDTETPGYPSYNQTLTTKEEILSKRDEIVVEFDKEFSALVINGDTSCLKDTVEITERNTSTFNASRNNTKIDFDLSKYKTRKCEKSPLTIGIKIDYVNGDIAFNNSLIYPEAEVTDKINFKLEDKKIKLTSATDKPMRVDCFEKNATVTITVDGKISKSDVIPIEDTGILDVTDYVDDVCKSTIFKITLNDVDGSQYEHSENLKYNETLRGTLKLNGVSSVDTEKQSYIIEMSTTSDADIKCLVPTATVTSNSLPNDKIEIPITFQDSKISVIPLDQFMEKSCKATNITVEVKDVEQMIKLEQNYTLWETEITGSVFAEMEDSSENKMITLESSSYDDDVLGCIQSIVINNQSYDYKGSTINVSHYFMDNCIDEEVKLDIIDHYNVSRLFGGEKIFKQQQTEFLPDSITAGQKLKIKGKLLLKLDSDVTPVPCLKDKATVTDANYGVTQQPIVQENGTTFIDITKLESCQEVYIDIDIMSRANKSITLKNVIIDDRDEEGDCTGEMFEENGNQLFNITCDHPSILNCLPEYAQVMKISDYKTESIRIIKQNNQALINLTKFQMGCTDIEMLLSITDEKDNLTLNEIAVVKRLHKKQIITGSIISKRLREAYFSIDTNDYSWNCLKNTSSVTVSATEEIKSIDILRVNESKRIDLTDYIANCTETAVVIEIRDVNNEEALSKMFKIPRFFPHGKSNGIFKDDAVMIRANETILHCLKDISEVTNIITSEMKNIAVNDYRIDVSIFHKKCEESILKVVVYDKSDIVSLSENIEQSLPRPELTIENGAFRVNHNNSKFKECEEMIHELECEDENGVAADERFKFGELPLTSEYQGKKCKVRVFTKSYQDHLNDRAGDLFEGSSNYTPAWSKVIEIPISASIVQPVIGSMSVLLVLVIVVFGGGFLYRKKKNEDAEYNVEIVPLTSNYNNYRVFTKDKTLQKHLHTAAKKKKDAAEEFKAIETWAEEEVEKVNTKEFGKENRIRNRYQDMVPYDHNRMKLKTKNSIGGNPPSDYINASPIKFTDFSQKFIAIQAPKPNMINSFWQLVIEQKVSVIVMITDLIEKGRVKAHKYWPDRENPVMDVGGGITVKYLSHSFPGTYYHREMLVTDSHGKESTVDQVHCVAWADMEAPKETKVLLDLLYKVQDLSEEKPGPIMVHCSAGVGRTGTFIGFYKLAQDYLNDNVNEINVFNAVSEMRKCRRFMVQKPPQYHYIYKCLADYVKAQEAVYD